MKPIISAGIIEQTRKVLVLIDRRYRGLLVLLLAVTIAASFLEVVSIAAVFPVFQVMLDPGRVTRLAWFHQFLGDIALNRLLLWACILIFVLFVLKFVVSLFATWLKWHLQSRLYQNLSQRLFNSYLESPLSFHLQHSPTELLRNLSVYVSQTTQYGFLGLIDLTSDGLLTVGIFLALFWVEPVISILALVSLATISVVYIGIGQPYFLLWGRRFKVAVNKVYKMAQEPLIGIKTIKVLGREEYFEREYQLCVEEYCDIQRMNSFIGSIPRQVLELIAVGALVGAIGWSVLEGRNPATLIPVLVVFAAATYRIMPAIVRMTATLQNFHFGHDSIDVVYADIMRTQVVATRASTAMPTKEFYGDIVLENATFFYDGTSRPALDRINLVIRSGEAVAFVGTTGAGKTTLADLILGFHKIESGELIIGNISCRDPASIPRGAFGYVPQDPFLIDDTIRRNIALGLTDAQIDEGQLSAAIKTAALEEFVSELPEGLETVVGDRGVRLSGGQRQRIGIARAMYANPAVLVLDEATSSVDITTEAEITDAINRLRGVKTLIVVAHRLSTIQKCDRIFYLKAGRVISSGRYDELVQKNADFARMVRQMGTDRHLSHAPKEA